MLNPAGGVLKVDYTESFTNAILHNSSSRVEHIGSVGGCGCDNQICVRRDIAKDQIFCTIIRACASEIAVKHRIEYEARLAQSEFLHNRRHTQVSWRHLRFLTVAHAPRQQTILHVPAHAPPTGPGDLVGATSTSTSWAVVAATATACSTRSA